MIWTEITHPLRRHVHRVRYIGYCVVIGEGRELLRVQLFPGDARQLRGEPVLDVPAVEQSEDLRRGRDIGVHDGRYGVVLIRLGLLLHVGL